VWNTSGVVRLSLVYRGRAVPLGWKVLEHPSSRVAYDMYKDVLDRVAELLPCRCPVVLTADRGVADTHRMAHRARLGWHWRIRLKGSVGMYRDGKRGGQVKRMPWSPGKALFWHGVYSTQHRYGPGPIAMARCHAGKADGFVVSDAPPAVQTFEESGWRVAIAEHCWDDQANGVPLESSLIRSAAALERLCLGLAITTRYLVAQGTAVVQQGQRRWVDAHGCRGQSSLKIGWHGVTLALSRGYTLVTRVH